MGGRRTSRDTISVESIFGPELRSGYAAEVSNGGAEVTGRKPRSFEEFVCDHRDAFTGTPA